IQTEPTQVYKQITVRLWGNGLALRGEVTGDELGSSRWFVARAGQFILSRIDARHGAFGVVPEFLDGAIVSNDFPLFNVDTSKLEPQFLYLLSKRHEFIHICKAASEGTTNRDRLKINRFLGSKILLPPLDEQRRIVAYIETIAAQVADAHDQRERAINEAEAIWQSTLNAVFSECFELYTNSYLENVCSEIIDNLHSTPIYDGDEFPCIRSQDVGWGTINYHS